MEHHKGWRFTKIGLIWYDFGIKGLSESAVLYPDHKAGGKALAFKTSRASAIMECARLLMVQFAHSETPFSWGVYGLVTSLLMPFSAKKVLKALEVYSPPPSIQRILRLLPVSFSAWAFQALKTAKASSLDLQKPM